MMRDEVAWNDNKVFRDAAGKLAKKGTCTHIPLLRVVVHLKIGYIFPMIQVRYARTLDVSSGWNPVNVSPFNGKLADEFP
jgi:hypothetical protein